MNANIKNMIAFYKRKNLNGVIYFESEGRNLSDSEARKFLKWADEKGYETFKDIPKEEEDKKEWLNE